MKKMLTIQGRPIIEGRASGDVLYSHMGLSFWGGVDAHTGCVIDKRHDLCGQKLTGKILCLERGRGSCSSSGIIVEMIRAKTAPAAIISMEVEGILAVGSVIAQEMYGRTMPVCITGKEEYAQLSEAGHIELSEDGLITCEW